MFQVLLFVVLLMQPAPPAEAPLTPVTLPDESDPADPQAPEQRFREWGENVAALDLFSKLTYRYTGRGYRDRLFNYRLFVPEVAGPDDKRPLLVWLHGKGEAGEDNLWHLRYLSTRILPPPWDRKRYPFFLLAVQCPTDDPLWMTNSQNADDMLNVVLAVLEKTTADYPVDLDRISLAGISSGGSGCWELAMRRPDLFSCVAPMASGGGDVSRIERLINLPVWSFHSQFDTDTPVDGVRATVRALEAAGGTVHLTEISSTAHDCWDAAFEEHDLLSWLLSQKRGAASGRPPGTLSLQRRFHNAWQGLTTGWTPGALLGQIGIPVVIFVAIWSARRKRRLHSPLPVVEESSG